MSDAVHDAWLSAVTGVGGDAAAARDTAAELVAAYRQPDRRYHGVEHIRDVLANVGLLRDEGIPAEEGEHAALVLAACAHDVIHAGEAGADERASAMWAGEALLRAGVPPEVIARVQQLVLTTIDHSAPPGDDAAAVLCDADLAVLGGQPGDYDTYVAAIREEYRLVPDDEWPRGRADVLRALLAKSPLYATAAARQRWEAGARENLHRELASLETV